METPACADQGAAGLTGLLGYSAIYFLDCFGCTAVDGKEHLGEMALHAYNALSCQFTAKISLAIQEEC